MKLLRRVGVLLLCAALTFGGTSCVDLGEGLDENSFQQYFSKVWLLSHSGLSLHEVSKFHQYAEGETEIEQVVPMRDYCYIAFCVSDYTLTVNDFAFFAKTNGGSHTMVMEFYITNELPTRLKDSGSDEYVPLPSDPDENAEDADVDKTHIYEDDGEGGTVPREETDETELFSEAGYAKSTFEVDEEWDSVYLNFDKPQTVTKGQFIVVRIKNNCILDIPDPDIRENGQIVFTFNHLMFNFSGVTKH